MFWCLLIIRGRKCTDKGYFFVTFNGIHTDCVPGIDFDEKPPVVQRGLVHIKLGKTHGDVQGVIVFSDTVKRDAVRYIMIT